MSVTTTYIGVIDGLHTYEVRDENGTVIGKNESPYPPCPGEGYMLDETSGTWIKSSAPSSPA
jgi:hypothetical protein